MINWKKVRALLPTTKKEIFYPAWKKNQEVSSIKLAKLMAKAGSFSAGVTTGTLLDLPNFVADELLQSNEVKVTGLGSFKLKIRGKAKEKAEDVNINGAQLDIVFEPEKELISYIRSNAQYELVKLSGAETDDTSTVTNASTGDYILDDPTVDTSTGTDASTGTNDTSTGTADTSTGGNTNDGDDGLGG